MILLAAAVETIDKMLFIIPEICWRRNHDKEAIKIFEDKESTHSLG